jgi:hypothetical protein
LTIANVSFSLKFNAPLTPSDFDKTFNSFLKTNNDSASIDIEISFNLDTPPNTTKLTKIYDGGLSWSMFKNSCNYYMMQNPSSLENKPQWVTSFAQKIKKVTIFVDKSLVFKNNERFTVPNLISNPVGQILLMYFLSNNKGALIHAAGAEFEGRGYIFPGKSGAGKSTLTRQLACIDGFSVLSDDRIVVRKTENTFKAFGTPWPGEAGTVVNRSVNLSGIFFISHASSNKIKDLKPQKALEKLLPVVSIPWYDKEVMIKILDFCGELVSNIPAYEFQFKPDNKAIDVFKKFVTR